MKSTRVILIALAFCHSSCNDNFLDPSPTDRLAETAVWSSPSLIEAALNYNYNDLSYGIYSTGSIGDDNQMLANITDEVVSDYEGYERRIIFVDGSLNPDNVRSSRLNRLGWFESYNYIARANEFIERLSSVTVLPEEQKKTYAGEIKTLRAWRYFNLLKHFGGVPLISKTFKLGDDYFNVSRATIQETIDFILSDLNDALSNLPATAVVKGRIDKSVAEAFKSRVMLYAASPLFNNNVNDPAKWQAAADAAKAVMDAGIYSLEPDFEKHRQSFIFYDPANPEIIFAREHNLLDGTSLDPDFGVSALNPASSHGPLGSGGYSYYTPLQQLVNDYETADGLFVADPASGYDQQNPYVNRDPRFYAFIYYHGAVINGRALDYRIDGADRPLGGVYVNPTGYNTRKFVNEARYSPDGTTVLPGANEPTPWIHIRYAEILLNYAEAINEEVGPNDAYEPVNQIRRRAGMPDLPTGLSQSEMREKIRHERRIELVFEEHRFWDVRRWKILEETQNITIGAMIIEGDDPENVTYTEGPGEGYDLAVDRVFEEKHYFWPISRGEIFANPKLTQTPGY